LNATNEEKIRRLWQTFFPFEMTKTTNTKEWGQTRPGGRSWF